MARGVWYYAKPDIVGTVFRNNVIRAVCQNPKSTVRGAIVICGDGSGTEAPSLFEGNTVISNFCHVLLGEPYGVGSNARFVGNRFVKVGRRRDYRTINIGYWNKTTAGHRFIDSTFEGGAGYDKVKFEAEGKREFSVGWTLTVKTEPGAKVTIADAAGKEVFSGQAGGDGAVSAAVLQYSHTPDGKTMLTPHTVTAAAAGKTASRKVTVDATKTVELPLK
jgi:hypothetical protein